MKSVYRRRRLGIMLLIVCSAVVFALFTASGGGQRSATAPVANDTLASEALGRLAVKPRLSKQGYSREFFSDGWKKVAGCDIRNRILQRDMAEVTLEADGCVVVSGTLYNDAYTAKTIQFRRGKDTSRLVQIDHIVAVSDAWQKGAQSLSSAQREALYNDPLNLLAVDGSANMQKGDGDAASWLPPNKSYRCRYIARQIAVKQKYHLWVTEAEQSAMRRVLFNCPGQVLPIVTGN